MHYDLCVRVPVSQVSRAIEVSSQLGWDGFCMLVQASERKKAGSALSKSAACASLGLLIEPRNANDLRRRVSSSRKKWEIIAASCGTPEMARTAAETGGLDIITDWEDERETIINYITAKLAAENGVAIAFSFRPLLEAYDRSRARIMARMREVAGFVMKYKTSAVLTSGVVSSWNLRSPSELMAFARLLGFSSKAAKQSVSGSLLVKNRKKLAGKWVMPGVEKA